MGILYSNHWHNIIECFSEANWAGSKEDRSSTSEYCVFVKGNLISWKSKNRVLSLDLVQSLNIEQSHSPCVRLCGFINS